MGKELRKPGVRCGSVFRILWGNTRGGSIPPFRTNEFKHLLLFAILSGFFPPLNDGWGLETNSWKLQFAYMCFRT